MYFSKNEIIELSSGAKHMVVDTLKFNNSYYYYVAEVTNDESEVLKNFRVITTISENGNLFVKSIKGDLENTLLNIFREKVELKDA